MQISNIENEKMNIMVSINKIKGIITEYFKNLYTNKLQNLDEMYKFLDAFDLTKLNQRM
jgi:hypothetical protein